MSVLQRDRRDWTDVGEWAGVSEGGRIERVGLVN